MSQGIKIAFGGAGIRDDSVWSGKEGYAKLKKILSDHQVKIIDTAQLYGPSEKELGNAHAGDDFILDTRWVSSFLGDSASKDIIVKTAHKSIETLNVKNVDIFYLHCPDAKTPISETLAGVQEAYKSGLFKRFGLSNYRADDVQKVYDHCKEQGYVLPTAYQGNYSPVARLQETLLFPTLHKLGISFYAYSPLAGGFLTKTKKQIEEGIGRFDKSTPIGQMYGGMYGKPSYLEALAQWESIAKEAGCSNADLAYRWVTYNSILKPENGDAIIVGARTEEQLDQTLSGIKAGPLTPEIAKKIDGVWETIKHEAPLDNYNQTA